VESPLKWVWENDPKELPDDGHARCIAAHGERFVACGGQLFVLTTRPCTRSAASGSGAATLQMEYLGFDWPRGLAQRYWGSDPFVCGPSTGEAKQSVGLALLETVAGALAAGSAVSAGSPGPSRVGFDDLRLPLRPPGWPPRPPALRAPCASPPPFNVRRRGITIRGLE
jgi:hypothetical protein